MRKKVLTVEDHFQIQGWGLVIVGKTLRDSAIVYIGISVIIVLPNGEEFETKISGIPMNCPPNFKLVSLVFSSLTTKEVPISSEVFLVE